ncbi:TPA: YhcH/YjgK/YiaL family protein [Streptococcus equi subsp. zooepidemicus]|nr:YhcH/YjgK/YiaL family protein [Streptococcus equi subsp. zooepidemicus]
MLYDVLENIRRYKGIHRHLDVAIDFLLTRDLRSLTDGKHVILEDKVVLFIQHNCLNKEDNALFEYHKRYADLHLLVEGNERVRYGLGYKQEAVSFDEASDIGFVTCERTYDLDLGNDRFCYFFPNEAHQPNGFNDGGDTVTKCLIKVLMED